MPASQQKAPVIRAESLCELLPQYECIHRIPREPMFAPRLIKPFRASPFRSIFNPSCTQTRPFRSLQSIATKRMAISARGPLLIALTRALGRA